MILVDTSVWIDFFGSFSSATCRELERLLSQRAPLAITGIVVAEIVQGLRGGVEEVEAQLRSWPLLEPGGFEAYRHAAEVYC